MDKIRDYLRGSSALLSDAAIICLFFYMIPTCTQIRIVSVAVPVWAGFILVLMGADYLLAGAGISFNLYLILNGAGILAGTYFTVTRSFCSDGFPMFHAFLACAVAGVGAHGAAAAWRLPSANSLLRYVDGLVILLAFYLYAAFSTRLEPGQDVLILSLSAIILNLISVNQIRTREEGVSVIQGSGTGGKLVLAAAAAGIAAVTGMVTGAASGQVHSAVDLLLAAVKGVGKVLALILGAVGLVLGTLLNFLAGLLPDAPQEAGETVKTVIQEEAKEAAETAVWRIPGWVMAMVLALALALTVCYILYHFRNARIKRSKRESPGRTVVKKSNFWPALSGGCRKIWESARFEWLSHLYRKTPEGLFVRVEKIGKRRKNPRRKNESPGEYLRRIAGCLRAEEADGKRMADREEWAGALEGLAGDLDRIYYGFEQKTVESRETGRYVKAVQELEKW
ncbi:hypothetical protein GPL15_15990 [Clostridium sp. MCC353]|uniref:hypothetical protein n=1 Tax=Clostridium sp. MCC353 TaxID=2592646 RepID=UPI001C019B65|nr:hypothetical protein [Clostridium sp. MCC353]MBT9778002.1 hypothetical protein [Clostridium sp. MCC353]